jgi:hypothetical protein
MNDTALLDKQGSRLVCSQVLPLLEEVLLPQGQPVPPAQRGRGRPVVLEEAHLWLGVLMCVLCGMNSYAQLWRQLCTEGLGPFAPVLLSADAVVSRLLQAGLAPLCCLLEQVSTRLARRLAPYTVCDAGSLRHQHPKPGRNDVGYHEAASAGATRPARWRPEAVSGQSRWSL